MEPDIIKLEFICTSDHLFILANLKKVFDVILMLYL
jgi:hypothetical protein